MEPEVTTITEDLNILSKNQIIKDFYIVSLLKLVILFSCTLGLYMIYWFYRQWKQQKNVAGEDCWPIMRGIFLIFFTHSLFENIDKKLRITKKRYNWSPQYTATLFVILVLASRIFDQLSLKGIGLPYSDIAGLLILPIIAGLLVYVQRIINFTCDDIEGESNNQFTILNFLWITVGIIFLALYLIGSALSPSA